MSCWAVIPVRAPGEGKNRLSAALDEASRHALVGAMLANVVRAVEGARNVAVTCLLGPSRHGLAERLTLLSDPGEGLNPALQAALAEITRRGATRAVFVAADLPQLTTQDVALLAAAAPGAIAIAPDRHGMGTNALSLPLPEAAGFAFAFGEDSFARHHDEAVRLGLPVETVHSHGLERDIDEPRDLPDAAEMMRA